MSTGQGILGHNMFSYCENNPVVRADPEGRSSLVMFGLALVVTVVSAAVSYYPIESKNKESYNVSELRMDTDGADSEYGSSSHQSGTSFEAYKKVKLRADKVPFIVIPINYEQLTGMSISDAMGCMGKIVDNNTGKYVFAIVGDVGSAKRGMGEVSLKAAWDLGFSYREANGMCGPEGNFTITIYKDVKVDHTASDLYREIQITGRRIFSK